MWFYTCNNKTFDFKFLAISEHLKTKQPIHFHAPEEYNTFDFSIEPNETWATLLKNEAIKLRETYQFIKLWYSGGADSHLILTTFIENNIHIDEICCMKSGFENADYEISNYAEPFLKTIQEQIPKTKISIINPTISDYENYYNKEFTKNTAGWGYSCFRLIYHDELIKDHNQREGLVNVFGAEAPIILKKNNNWYTYWLDASIEPNLNKYNFFANNPAIHSKQCHMLLKSCDLNKDSNNHFYGDKNEQDFFRNATGRLKRVMPYKKMYYGENKNYFTLDNEKIHYSNNKEEVAIQTAIKRYPNLVKTWKKRLFQLMDQQSQWWNYGTPEYGTVNILSKFYCLTDNHNKTVDELYPDGFKP